MSGPAVWHGTSHGRRLNHASLGRLKLKPAANGLAKLAPWEERLTRLRRKTAEAAQLIPVLSVCLALLGGGALAPVCISCLVTAEAHADHHRVLGVSSALLLLALVLGCGLGVALHVHRAQFRGAYRRTWHDLETTSLAITIAEAENYYQSYLAEHGADYSGSPLRANERFEDSLRIAVLNREYLRTVPVVQHAPLHCLSYFRDDRPPLDSAAPVPPVPTLAVTSSIALLGPLGCLFGLLAMAFDRCYQPATLGAMTAVCDFFLHRPDRWLLHHAPAHGPRRGLDRHQRFKVR